MHPSWRSGRLAGPFGDPFGLLLVTFGFIFHTFGPHLGHFISRVFNVIAECCFKPHGIILQNLLLSSIMMILSLARALKMNLQAA